MSDSKKTGLFWLVAASVFAIGLYAGWPTRTLDRPLQGTVLFEEFTDPLAAADVKVVTFDESAGQLDEFVVRKNDKNIWTIASKSDYPADALDQVTKAANALIGLKVLDVQTVNPEDHDDLGVLEPDVRRLQVGDEGVGRLVTFRDKDRGELASMIIGDAVKDEEGKRYVRRPGEDPVYVVNFDPASVTTRFEDWIEEDLLQLSSIEIQRVVAEDYEATLGGPQRFSLKRNYVYEVEQSDEGWKLVQLSEYGEGDLTSDPTPVEVGEDQTLNTSKLNDMKNALDDLKFVDAYRKPKGIGETLQADAELVKDDETVRSLMTRGFYPVSFGQSDRVEILSANGEMRVSTKDGIQYTLRFGNIASAGGDEKNAEEISDSETDDDAAIDREGVNRYLLVTTSVDETQFPAPDLQPIPASIEELKAQRGGQSESTPDGQSESSAADEAAMPRDAQDGENDVDGEAEGSSESATSETAVMVESQVSDASKLDDAKQSRAQPTESEVEEVTETASEGSDESNQSNNSDNAAAESEMPKDASNQEEKSADDDPANSNDSGEQGDAEVQGDDQATGSGGGQAGETEEGNDSDDRDESESESEPSLGDSAEPASDAEARNTETPNVETSNVETSDAATSDRESADVPTPSANEMTDQEWQELLEAEQEKITKSNQRLVDARRDSIKKASQEVAQLNARFADWFYVIPESTYRKLRVGRQDLFEKADEPADGEADGAAESQMPAFNIPGLDAP